MNEKEREKNTREPFFIVPSRVFELGLNAYELAVLFYLMMRCDNEKHTCWPSEKGIARACGMSLATVKRTVKSLEEKNLININKQFSQSKNGLYRQTANLYTIWLCETPPAAPTDTPPGSVGYPPQLTQIREINKTKPNRTKSNITKTTELKEAAEGEEKRNNFLELKENWFEILKNENGFEDEKISLLERALEHLWYKKESEYEGRKYAQNEVWEMLCDKCSPEILSRSAEFLRAQEGSVRACTV